MNNNDIKTLEIYSQSHPEEVLIVKAKDGDLELEIMIFKGFSSNLSGETAFDPDISILSPQGQIISFDRILSPYNPENPQYLEKDVKPSEFNF